MDVRRGKAMKNDFTCGKIEKCDPTKTKLAHFVEAKRSLLTNTNIEQVKGSEFFALDVWQ